MPAAGCLLRELQECRVLVVEEGLDVRLVGAKHPLDIRSRGAL
jgi:hypothetical protein